MAIRSDRTHALLPCLPGIPLIRCSAVFPHAQGGPRDEAPGARSGASDPVTPKCPAPQCRQARHSIRATRRMNASTDSITTGSGIGASSAALLRRPARTPG